MTGRLIHYARYAWRFGVLRRPEPLIYGMAITDRCNFSCKGCHVANTDRPDMTWETLVGHLHDAYARGFREVYFTGGEPTLWRDGERALVDAIEEARRIGFFHVHVYTNGTHGLDWPRRSRVGQHGRTARDVRASPRRPLRRGRASYPRESASQARGHLHDRPPH